MSGLTLGLMSLDLIGLRVVMAIGNADDLRHARKIFPLRQLGNWLLCTLTLSNTLLNCLISIQIDELLSGGIWGIVGPTAVIFVFGELLPQILCFKYSLVVGSCSVPIVWVMVAILSPITWPIARLLDCAVGRDAGTPQTSQQLQETLVQHAQIGVITEEQAQLNMKITRGIFGFRDSTISDIMLPIESCFSLEWDDQVDHDLLREVHHSGFSRIPVYKKSKQNVAGVLLCKDLLMIKSQMAHGALADITVGEVVEVFGVDLVTFRDDTPLSGVLEKFKNGSCHMAIVADDWAGARGIVTMEDIFCQILQDRIFDEDDHYSNRPKRTSQSIPIVVCAESNEGLANWLVKTGFGAAAGETQMLTATQLSDLLSQAPEETYNGTVFETGKLLNTCFLVLSGTVEVKYKHGRCYSVGKYAVLAEKAIYQDDFYPDFTACVTSKDAKLLPITREYYKLAVSSKYPEHSSWKSVNLDNTDREMQRKLSPEP